MINDIPTKANRVLNLILLCLILILIRVWYLDVVQHDKYVDQARRPQRKVVIEPTPRATISDRFGIPLAVNKIQYNAAVCYAHIRDIPSIVWKRDETGKTKKVFARTEHISQLSKMLAADLNMDPQKVEDMIYGKAALFPHTPFVIKEDITEQQYYSLRMLEKDWVGLQMQKSIHRSYPQGKVACDLLGYLGPISQKKYLDLSQEMQELEEYLAARDRNENPILPRGFDNPLQARKRLEELQEMSYTINDLVGKAGVESSYEEELRGRHGKKIYEVDVKGNFLRELPISKSPLSGKHVTLTISSELQAYAEELLSAMEGPPAEDKKERWIRGGAVVAMIPQTGEIVAMASHPRFDPNDFIPSRDADEKREKEMAVQRWLESEQYIGEIWDGKRPLEREYFSFTSGKYEEERHMMTWDRFLDAILAEGSVREVVRRASTIEQALRLQDPDRLGMIALEEDRRLVIDLLRLQVDPDLFSPALIGATSSIALYDYHLQRQAVMRIEKAIKADIQELYFDTDFKAWRASAFKEYLKRKRKEEKQQKKYPRPYTEYLDQAEKSLFSAFWETYKPIFLYTAIAKRSPIDIGDYPQLSLYLSFLQQKKIPSGKELNDLQTFLSAHAPMTGLDYLRTMKGFHELTKPLVGNYPRVRKGHLQKHLAAAFYPLTGYGYGRSVAFRQQSALGSVFKLVTAYQALSERLEKGKHDLNPLTIIDDLHGDRKTFSPTQILGYTIGGQPILRSYKGGILPRSSHKGFGKIDLYGALEQSSNVYFAMVAGDHLEDPNNLAKAAKQFGFGQKTGVDLPGEVPGNVPDDLNFNKTGLYSFAIGQHTLATTPLQTAVMTSLIANKGTARRPTIVKSLSGDEKKRDEEALVSQENFRFEEPLSLVGIDFPLFTQAKNSEQLKHVEQSRVAGTYKIDFPEEVYGTLTEAMRRVVQGARGTARPAAMRDYMQYPTSIRDYYAIHNNLLAKTGTAQVRFKDTIDAESTAVMKSNTCFAGVSYSPGSSTYDNPELVVVVLIRHGHAGSDGGPITAEIIKKWRELKARHEKGRDQNS